MLRNIDIDFQAQVIGLLKWLAFSNEALRVEQLAEIFILRPERPVAFDVAERLFRPDDCLKYLSDLVITYNTVPVVKWDGRNKVFVRLAHFSVEEYLISDRIVRGPTDVFRFTEYDAHLYIAHSCLAYHLQRTAMTKRNDHAFELRYYAVFNWTLHLQMVPRERWPAEVVCLAARALAVRSESLRDILATRNGLRGANNREYLLRPHCYTARRGLVELTRILLSGGPGTNRYLTQADLDAALLQAVYSGSIAVVNLLLDNGAHVNAGSDRLGYPLWVAASMENENVIELLLKNGADVNLQHSTLGSALQAAASSCHLHILRLLVRRGADVNLAPNKAGCALTSAIVDHNLDDKNISTECLRFLLDNGANINSQGGIDGPALHKAAARLGRIDRARGWFYLLLERGADVNAQGGEYGYPLQAACTNFHTDSMEEVKLLLERGANVNAQGGKYGNALQAACVACSVLSGIHGSTVEFLLKKGANVNMQGGELGTPLQAACVNCHMGLSLVEFLLEQGAGVNIQGGDFGNALQAACYAGSLEGAKLLLEHGANINAQGGEYGSALQAACRRGHLEMVQFLLDQGADVNAPGGEFGGALHAAASALHDDTINLVELLLSKGADINKLGGCYGTALQYACLNNNVKCMRLLIERGADVHVQAGMFGSPWHTAAATDYWGNGALQLLLDHGVDINDTRGREHATALQAAIEDGHNIDRVRFLVDRGADIHAKAGKYGSLLQSACATNRNVWLESGPKFELDSDTGSDSEIDFDFKLDFTTDVESNYSWRMVAFLLQICPEIDVNEERGNFGSALQAAAYSGQTKSVKLLLHKGAHVNTRGGKYGSALNAAIMKGFWDIVEILLDHGAKSDRQQFPKPDEEWLARVQEEDGGEAVERYRIFWEKQVITEDLI